MLSNRPWNEAASEYSVVVRCFTDENWDDDQLLGFEPCNENLVSGCNIINGKCECDTIRTCNNPFEFPRKDMCLSALKRIEGKYCSHSCQAERCVVFEPEEANTVVFGTFYNPRQNAYS